MNPYATVEEAAQILRLNPETVRRKCRKGELDFHRTGRKYLIPISALLPDHKTQEDLDELLQ